MERLSSLISVHCETDRPIYEKMTEATLTMFRKIADEIPSLSQFSRRLIQSISETTIESKPFNQLNSNSLKSYALTWATVLLLLFRLTSHDLSDDSLDNVQFRLSTRQRFLLDQTIDVLDS